MDTSKVEGLGSPCRQLGRIGLNNRDETFETVDIFVSLTAYCGAMHTAGPHIHVEAATGCRSALLHGSSASQQSASRDDVAMRLHCNASLR